MTIKATNAAETGTMISVTKAMTGLMTNIMTSTPTIVVTEVMSSTAA